MSTPLPKPTIGYAAVQPDGQLSLHQLRKPSGEYSVPVVVMSMAQHDALQAALSAANPKQEPLVAAEPARKTIKMRVKSLLLDLSCHLDSMVYRLTTVGPDDGKIRWRDYFRWWCEKQFLRLWNRCYEGSYQEIRDAWDIPEEHRTPLQRAIVKEFGDA